MGAMSRGWYSNLSTQAQVTFVGSSSSTTNTRAEGVVQRPLPRGGLWSGVDVRLVREYSTSEVLASMRA
jgi:hypothetical protein